jgi:hypothetical protein
MVNRRMFVAGLTIALAFLLGAFLHSSYPYHSSERELGFGIQSAAISLNLLWWVAVAFILLFRWRSTTTAIRVLFALNCVVVFAAVQDVLRALSQ